MSKFYQRKGEEMQMRNVYKVRNQGFMVLAVLVLMAVLGVVMIAPAMAQTVTEVPVIPAGDGPVVVVQEPGFDYRDLMILVLLGIVVAQALLTRNMLPLPLVRGLLGIAEDYAKRTPSTRDDDLIRGAKDLLDAKYPPTAAVSREPGSMEIQLE